MSVPVHFGVALVRTAMRVHPTDVDTRPVQITLVQTVSASDSASLDSLLHVNAGNVVH